jgi:hypothetical protein
MALDAGVRLCAPLRDRLIRTAGVGAQKLSLANCRGARSSSGDGWTFRSREICHANFPFAEGNIYINHANPRLFGYCSAKPRTEMVFK